MQKFTRYLSRMCCNFEHTLKIEEEAPESACMNRFGNNCKNVRECAIVPFSVRLRKASISKRWERRKPIDKISEFGEAAIHTNQIDVVHNRVIPTPKKRLVILGTFLRSFTSTNDAKRAQKWHELTAVQLVNCTQNHGPTRSAQRERRNGKWYDNIKTQIIINNILNKQINKSRKK
jgi:hypothetical protein